MVALYISLTRCCACKVYCLAFQFSYSEWAWIAKDYHYFLLFFWWSNTSRDIHQKATGNPTALTSGHQGRQLGRGRWLWISPSRTFLMSLGREHRCKSYPVAQKTQCVRSACPAGFLGTQSKRKLLPSSWQLRSCRTMDPALSDLQSLKGSQKTVCLCEIALL